MLSRNERTLPPRPRQISRSRRPHRTPTIHVAVLTSRNLAGLYPSSEVRSKQVELPEWSRHDSGRMVQVRILYFASVRARKGLSQEILNLPERLTAADVSFWWGSAALSSFRSLHPVVWLLIETSCAEI